MSLEEIYYIGQTIAVFLIFGSLVALYLQRHRDKVLDQMMRNREAGERFSNWFNRMRDDPEYARIIRVSAHHWEEMPDNAKFVAHLFWTSVVYDAQTAQSDVKHGLGKAAHHDQVFQGLVGALMMPGLRAWWEKNKAWTTPDFQSELDGLLARPGPAVRPWHEIMPLWKASDRDLAILIADEAVRLPASAKSLASDTQTARP